MKLFLSTSFSHKIDPLSREVVPEYREFVAELLRGLRAAGHEIFCAVEAEGWQLTDGPQHIGVGQDLQHVDSAEAILALVHEQQSAGVQFEIGYAVARGTPVILARAEADQLAYFNQGLVGLELVTAVTYDSAQTLLQQLLDVLKTDSSSVSD